MGPGNPREMEMDCRFSERVPVMGHGPEAHPIGLADIWDRKWQPDPGPLQQDSSLSSRESTDLLYSSL